jgi:predicted amidohydrolase
MEAKTILYCGKSSIFTPDGKIAKIASSNQEEILFYEILLEDTIDKTIDNQINIIDDRRPKLYSELVQLTATLPVYSIMKEELNSQTLNPLAAVVQIESENDFDKYLQKIDFFVKNLLEQEADLIIFPENDLIFPERGEEIIEKTKQITNDHKTICVITIIEKYDSLYYKTTFLIESGKVLGKYRKTHLEKDEKSILTPGDLGLPVFKTPYGYIGIMIGYEGLFPEISRILTLKGADMIIWPSKFTNDRQINICRTRSAENKIFVACSNSIYSLGSGHSLITSPSGQILTSCLGKTEQASLSPLFLHLSRNKNIVPHTNTILNRQPESYRILVNNISKKEI